MEVEPKKPPKILFEYDDYRDYLADFYVSAKAEKKKFSFRYFSRIAGFKSPNFLKRVIDGESNLSRKSMVKFATALKLSKEETRFFTHLVLFNQATNADQRAIYARELVRLRSRRQVHPIGEAQYEFFSHWFYVAVRELVALPGFKEDPSWMAEQLRPRVSTDEIKKALDVLMSLQLLVRDEHGRLVQADMKISTEDEVASSAILEGHREVISLASEALSRFPASKRDVSAVSFSSSAETTRKIKRAVHEFRQRILDIAAEDPAPNQVYQLNLQLFPLVELSEPGAKEDAP